MNGDTWSAPFGGGWIVSEYDVTLDAVGQTRVPVMKAIRAHLNIQLMEAKTLLDRVPCRLMESADRERAMAFVSALREAGAAASVSCRPEEYPAGCYITAGWGSIHEQA